MNFGWNTSNKVYVHVSGATVELVIAFAEGSKVNVTDVDPHVFKDLLAGQDRLLQSNHAANTAAICVEPFVSGSYALDEDNGFGRFATEGRQDLSACGTGRI